MSESPSFKKPLLYALIVSVIAGAILGIILVLRNTWGWFEVRVMLTTVIIAVSSLCGLACDLSKTPFGMNLLPRSGLVMTGIAAVMLLLGMWGDLQSELFWKSAIVICIAAVATVHVCLLSIAKLAGRFRWVYFIGTQIIFGLAALLSVIIFAEIDSEGVWRFVAAMSIVAAAISLVIPILHRISRMESRSDALLMPIDLRSVASIDEEIASMQKKIAHLQQLRNEIGGNACKPTNVADG
ncbi:hypothetical protein [Novipirellula artificiosorum]|uniref:Uncharacterized protein n=1 Tax=Novipirellula artificiosorum TaxID=2528016 RepID=A0A5C6DBZ3_9BACT|nr:hypothetical protein [Novipirellula artificiosorum]TWU34332.1 hypothetical protein Poly41_44790 [Novipirellula artificiosorum]